MDIDVFDKESSGKDKSMGKCKIDITEFISKGQFDGEINLYDNSMKNVGRISISTIFDRSDNDSKNYTIFNIIITIIVNIIIIFVINIIIIFVINIIIIIVIIIVRIIIITISIIIILTIIITIIIIMLEL